MAYFNYKLAEKRGLSPKDVHILQLIRQNRTEDMSEYLILEIEEENLKRLLAFDLLTTVKAKNKKDHDYRRLRLSKKGNTWYSDLQTVNTVENDFEMFNYVKKIYVQLQKDIGDENNVVNLIAWFRGETQFTHKQIFVLLNTFVNDDAQMSYSNILEYVIWKRPHIHAVKPALKDSRLWKYYINNKVAFDNKFEKLPTE